VAFFVAAAGGASFADAAFFLAPGGFFGGLLFALALAILN
jgi:hypothetical protein